MATTVRSLQARFIEQELIKHARKYWEHPMFRTLARWPQINLEIDSQSEVKDQLKQGLQKLRDVAICGLAKPKAKLSKEAKDYLQQMANFKENLWTADEYFLPKEDQYYLTPKRIGVIGNIPFMCACERFQELIKNMEGIFGLPVHEPVHEVFSKIRDLKVYLKQLKRMHCQSTEGELIATAMSWVQLLLAVDLHPDCKWLHLTSTTLKSAKEHYQKFLNSDKLDIGMLRAGTKELVSFLSNSKDNHQAELLKNAIDLGHLVIDVERREVHWGIKLISKDFRSGKVNFDTLLMLARKAKLALAVQQGDFTYRKRKNSEKQPGTTGFRKRFFDLFAVIPTSLSKLIKKHKLNLEPTKIHIIEATNIST